MTSIRRFTAALALTAVAAVGSMGAGASRADAATYGGTISVTGAKASWQWDTSWNKVSGRVYDTASDSKCAYVYDRGYNYILGWGGWKLLGKACGSGSSVSYGEYVNVYSDKVELKVCAGSSPCTVKRIRG